MKRQIKGNAQKYLSFKEAWARVKSAQEAGFYLEAIAIQESIMSDRITSYLSYKAMLPRKKRPSFADLVREWKKDTTVPEGKEFGDLRFAIDDVWRSMRNEAIHGLVKSEPGMPTMPVEEFIELSRCAARMGEKLAREVQNWHRKQFDMTK